MTEKKPDYTESAEKLINPTEVVVLLDDLHFQQGVMADIEAKIKEKCADEVEAASRQGEVLAELQNRIRKAIDTFGSFQDIEAGVYGVKYRRMTKHYHVEPFKRRYEKYVPAVVEETINVKALEGLVKGGLLTEDDLKHPEIGVITETPSFAYYIR